MHLVGASPAAPAARSPERSPWVGPLPYLGSARPCGDRSPARDGSHDIRLTSARIGALMVVRRPPEHTDAARRMRAAGHLPGSLVRIIRRAPLWGPLLMEATPSPQLDSDLARGSRAGCRPQARRHLSHSASRPPGRDWPPSNACLEQHPDFAHKQSGGSLMRAPAVFPRFRRSGGTSGTSF